MNIHALFLPKTQLQYDYSSEKRSYNSNIPPKNATVIEYYRTVLEGNDAFIRFKGAIAQNYVYTQLKSMGIDSYFWRTKSDSELDFITDYEGVLVPVETKSADNTKAKSLHQFCNRYSPKLAIKTSLKNVGDNMDGETHVWSIPLYTLFRFKEYLHDEMGWE